MGIPSVFFVFTVHAILRFLSSRIKGYEIYNFIFLGSCENWQLHSNLGWQNAPITISNVCSHPTGPRHLAPTQQDRETETRNQHLQHVTHIWDQSLRAERYIMLRRSNGQVTKVPGQAPHITTEYRVLCRQEVQNAAGQGLSPHPETEASGNHTKWDRENP